MLAHARAMIRCRAGTSRICVVEPRQRELQYSFVACDLVHGQ